MALRFAAVVFDLDGTLVDSAPDLCALVNEMLAELGRPGLELAEVMADVGDGSRALLERGLRGLGRGAADGRSGRLVRRVPAPLREAARASGPGLRGRGRRRSKSWRRPGSASGSAPTSRRCRPTGCSPALGLARFFGAVIGGDALPVRKPNAGHLRAVLARLGVDTAPGGDGR